MKPLYQSLLVTDTEVLFDKSRQVAYRTTGCRSIGGQWSNLGALFGNYCEKYNKYSLIAVRSLLSI